MMPQTAFDFICYGVPIRINSETPELGAEVAAEIRAAIPGVRDNISDTPIAAFDISRAPDGTTTALHDGTVFVSHAIDEVFYRVFSTYLRMTIAENSPELLFMHAGAVGWKGKAIILPGDSMVGKSTLVAELVRLGAEYYSDDYAVFDRDGLLYAFPREISMRSDDGKYTRYRLNPADLGPIGDEAIPVGSAWITSYEKGAGWAPERLSAGQGVLSMLPYTFGFVDRPDFSLPILNKVAADAIIIAGKRGAADIFAKTFLEFIDKADD